jgi:hypothetical protein
MLNVFEPMSRTSFSASMRADSPRHCSQGLGLEISSIVTKRQRRIPHRTGIRGR